MKCWAKLRNKLEKTTGQIDLKIFKKKNFTAKPNPQNRVKDHGGSFLSIGPLPVTVESEG